MKKQLVLLFVSFLSFSLFAQTTIYGPYVSGNWYKIDSPFLIEGDITIHQDSSLTIKHGVEVIFQGEHSFLINGIIQAIGIAGDSILFTVADTTGYSSGSYTGWGGLSFDYSMSFITSSKLEYCIIEYSKQNGLTAGGDVTGNLMDHCVIRYNTLNGIEISGFSNLSLTNLVVRNNKVNGIYICNTSFIYLENFFIIENEEKGLIGNEIFYPLYYPSVTLKNGSITNNNNCGLYLYCYNANLDNVIIRSNSTYQNGGGIFCSGSIDFGPTITANNVLIDDNFAFYGGGIYCSQNSNMMLDSITISNNIANIDDPVGGGIHCIDSHIEISHSLIISNNAADGGGGIYAAENAVIDIDRTVISKNLNSIGASAILLYGGALGDAQVNIVNSIIWDHSSPIFAGYTNGLTITYSDIEGGWTGTGNIDDDPLFTNPGNDDYTLLWTNYPFSWTGIKSPCIDSGDPASPPDPDGTIADMGAYYFDQPNTPITTGDISGTLACADSPFYIYTDLTVPMGQELVIEPCVHLIFMDDYRLNVDGRLQAIGNYTDYIWFYPADTAIGWQGIRFLNQNTNGQDSSRLEYCKIKYAKADGPGEDSKGGGVYCNNSSELLIKQCELSYNSAEKGGGIYCDSLSHPLISLTILDYNHAILGGGIYGDSSSFQLEDCFVRHNSASDKGGGIYVRAASSPLITNNSIYWNISPSGGMPLSGGGIYADSSNCQVISCIVQSNGATEKGGGIYCNGGSPVFSSDTISNNQADEGGGLYTVGSNLQVIDSYIYQNLATNGGGMYSDSCEYQMTGGGFSGNVVEEYGGGIYQRLGTANISGVQFNNNGGGYYMYPGRFGGGIFCEDANLTLSDLNFTNNSVSSAGGAGGGICSSGSILNLNNVEFSGCISDEGWGGGMSISGSPDCNLTDVTISNCLGYGGGGIACSGSMLSFLNVKIDDNSSYYGGGLYCSSSSLSMLNVDITGNVSDYGGGLHCSSSILSMLNVEINGNSSFIYGGGIYLAYSELTSEYSWICDNLCGGVGGGGIYMDGNSSMEVINTTFSNNSSISGGALYAESGSTASLLNSIIWQNIDNQIDGLGSINVIYSDVEGGWLGTGNINADPLFVDPGNNDFNLSWVNFPLNDITKSPCIDTGDPSSPLDPDGTRVDMGAAFFDQFQFSPDITSISDVPNDQGKQVVINWNKSPLDNPDTTLISSYSVWRMQNWAKEPWEFIGTIPAHFFDEYAFIAPTISDSTAAGVPYYTYLVSAETTDPFIFYNSLPDSGYSVDNLAPEPPKGFYGYQENDLIKLFWNPAGEDDFDYFALYKSNDPENFPAEPYATLSENLFFDPDFSSDTLYYRLTAFDFNGNESLPSETLEIITGKNLNLKIFLEGPFFVTQMIPYLNLGGYIPLFQPYNQLPWNYCGDEVVTQIPNSDIVDWVLLEFRDTTEAGLATGNTRVKRIAAFLKSDGSIVGLDGTNPPKVNISYNNNLYIVVWHRNHLGIMSALPVDETSGSYSYDFTLTPDNIFGGDKAVKFLNAGMWGMNAGDANADGQIDNKDKNDVWYLQLFTSGYLQGDFNMDTQTGMDDKTLWEENAGKGIFVPE